jgi:hypothetical protein
MMERHERWLIPALFLLAVSSATFGIAAFVAFVFVRIGLRCG